MALKTLVEVEGSGNNLPVGGITKITGALGDVLDINGTIFAKDELPGRVIPNFNTVVPQELKGYVDDPYYLPLTVGQIFNAGVCGAGISSTGTIISIKRVSSNAYIYRKDPTKDSYDFIESTSLLTNRDDMASRVVYAGNNKWCAAVGAKLMTSDDDGLTWASTSLPNTDFALVDMRAGDNGTIAAVFKNSESAGNTPLSLYGSNDGGLTWTTLSSTSSASGVCYTENNIWLHTNLSGTFYRSVTYDGATVSSNPNIDTISFRNSHLRDYTYFSNGIYYRLRDGNLFVSNDPENFPSAVGSNFMGLGVDDSGNALLIDTDGYIHKCTNGGAPVYTGTKVYSFDLGPSQPYVEFQYGNGIWVLNSGAFISDADLTAGNSWTDWNPTVNSQVKNGDTSSAGTSIVGINENCCVRSTDNWETFDLVKFNVNKSNLFTGVLSGATSVSGVATDNHGTWAVAFERTNGLLLSTDDGLTWSVVNLGLFDQASNSIGAVTGSDRENTFALTISAGTDNGHLYYTTNSFGGLIDADAGSGNIGCSQAVYHDDLFYWGKDNSTNDSICTVNVVTGEVRSDNIGDAGINVGSEMFNYGGTIFIETSIVRGISKEDGATPSQRVSVSQLSFQVGGLIDGEPTSTRIYQLTDDVRLNPLYASSTNGFKTLQVQGITNLNLETNEYIKVSQ